MNKDRTFKNLKAKIAEHQISRYGIWKQCKLSKEPLSRQTISNVLDSENGSILNVCTIIGAVNNIIKFKKPLFKLAIPNESKKAVKDRIKEFNRVNNKSKK